MDDKLFYFLLIVIGCLGASFLLMRKRKKGIRIFLIVLSSILLFNILHFSWVRSLPKGSGLGEAVGYAILTVVEAFGMVIFGLVWYFTQPPLPKEEPLDF